MTREEKIRNEAKKYATRCIEYACGCMVGEPDYITNQFVEFAEKVCNPWHKASEELPEVPEKKKYVKVLTTLRHGSGYDFRILYFHKDFGFSTHKEYQNAYYKDRKTGCVHWMYIPEIKED